MACVKSYVRLEYGVDAFDSSEMKFSLACRKSDKTLVPRVLNYTRLTLTYQRSGQTQCLYTNGEKKI